MKKTLTLIALALTTLSASAQVINVYKSDGTFVASYDGTHSVEMAKEAPATGPEYVTIGSLKWATMNLGATSIANGATSYGDYYAWGEVDTYYTSPLSWTDYQTATDPITFKSSDKTHITGTKTGYDWPNYCGLDNSDVEPTDEKWSPAPYDGDGVLTNDYDVVNKTYGGTWRMPKKEDFVNLCLACGVEQKDIEDEEVYPTEKSDGSNIEAVGVYWIKYEGTTITIDGTDYNVPGLLFVTSSTDTSKRVFFPAAGYVYGTSLNDAGTVGGYWSSSLLSSRLSRAYGLYFNSGTVVPQGNIGRCYGRTVRPVSE